MGRELRAGIASNGSSANIVVIEVDGDRAELRHIDERPRTSDDPLWFLKPGGLLDGKHVSKLSGCSVALNASLAHHHMFPIDNDLSQSEQNEQLHWEISNYLPDFQPKGYVSDVHVLGVNSREQAIDVLALTIERAVVFGVQEALEKLRVPPGAVDVTPFASEIALRSAHPEATGKSVALVCLSEDRFYASALKESALVNFTYGDARSKEEAVRLLRSTRDEFKTAEVYLHGSDLTFEWIKALRGTFDQVHSLNPFRKIRIHRSVTEFGKYIGREHRFAAAVGSALRP